VEVLKRDRRTNTTVFRVRNAMTNIEGEIREARNSRRSVMSFGFLALNGLKLKQRLA
jgi:hypothetical protein